MMKKICLLLTVIITLAGTGSCKKFLDKKSDSTLVTPSSLKDLQGILDDGAIMNLKRTPCYLETSADDYFLIPAYYDAIPVAAQKLYTWRPVPYEFGNDWSNAYAPVYNANLCLDLLQKVERTVADGDAWDNVKGSALFYRAYYFLWLAWDYAKAYDEQTADKDPGIVLRLGSDFNVPSIRASVAQSYARIIADVKECIPLLPTHPQHVLRPSRAAAYALLARTYHSMRHYDAALLYADSCLQIKNDLMDFNGDPDITTLTARPPFKQFNKETIFYTEMSSMFATLHFPSTGSIDTLLYKSYENNDLRKTAFFRSSNGYFTFKGSYTGNVNIYFSGLATDEMYLIRAECYARQNNTEAALADLDHLLSRRYAAGSYSPAVAQTSGEALNIILQEQRKELLMRGLRWMNIKRLNKEGYSITPKRIGNGEVFELPPNDPFYALPLPDDIIRTSGIPQN